MGSANRSNPLLPKGPMPGQKSIRLAKKGGGSSFPIAGFRRFSPGIPLPPLLYAETNRENRESSSRPFLSSAPAFLPGQRADGSQRPTKLEMIQNFTKGLKSKPIRLRQIYTFPIPNMLVYKED